MLRGRAGVLKCTNCTATPAVANVQVQARSSLNGRSLLSRAAFGGCPAPNALGRHAAPDRRSSHGGRKYMQRTNVVASPAADVASVYEKSFELRNGAIVKLTLELTESGDQLLNLVTDLQAGRLLLHWGVEGGKDYKGGWRLPKGSARPEGTVQYKDRALQSPWKANPDGTQSLLIALKGDEASDVLNFVLKDEATNSWYDCNGSNFACRLRGHAPDDLSSTDDEDEEVLPKALCDKWSWVRWDHEGRRVRTARQATADYDECVAQMKTLLHKGQTMEALWQVANGAVPYEHFIKEHLPETLRAPPPPPGPIPPDLLGVMAYLMWEKAGKPDGADFGEDARALIEKQLSRGKGYEQIAAECGHTLEGSEVRADPAKAPKPEQQQQQQQEGDVAKVEAPVESPQQAAVGSSQGYRGRNPLDLIKRSDGSQAPNLSADKASKQEKPLDFLVQRFSSDPALKWKRTYALGNKSELLAVVRQENERMPVRVDLITDLTNGVVVHWGVNKPKSRTWVLPSEELWPEGTEVGGHTACDTRMLDCEDDECDVEILGAKVPLQRCTIYLPPDHTVASLSFVMRSADNTMWYKDCDKDFFVPVPGKMVDEEAHLADPLSELPDELSRAIVEAEGSSAWTLMHRFNRATDLLSEVLNGYFEMEAATAMGIIFTWLRYSSTRQLTWQRNYNTQPRILSAAQERLTNTIAKAHERTAGEAQEWVRLMLSTVGRGGDGQRIRDEILHIMHRHNISESKGHWMEEWHQKLHNNTTPDDVPICEAYLAFLEGNGDMSAYWRHLSDSGLTRERLESFDRPITHEPQVYHGKRNELIGEFQNYLSILKGVHSGADLHASANAAGGRIPESARGFLSYVLSHVGDSQILPLMEAAVEARAELLHCMAGNRELLYLDLALEDQVRQAAERGVGAAGFGAAAFMKPLLQNLCLSLGDNEELCYCLKTWEELPASIRNGGRPSKEEALQAVAVINRIRRAISEVSDKVVGRIGGVSKVMGEAFGVDNWASELFAEEVVRGGPAFAVSLVITNVEPVLRNVAALGAWQVISPSPATGVVEVVEGLFEVQDKTYKVPTVLLAHQVTGEEEIPEGVVAVITPDAPDVLSHVSVRARNMHVLFATCHDPEPLEQIKQYAGKTLHFQTTASGAVSWEEATDSELQEEGDKKAAEKSGRGLKIEVPKWCGKWVVGMDEYKKGVVGAKSNNLAGLRGKLPAKIKLPASVTLPFGCFEQVLELPENKGIKAQLKALVAKLNTKSKSTLLDSVTSMMGSLASMDGGTGGTPGLEKAMDAASILKQCRELAMQVYVPDSVREELTAAMQKAGVPPPDTPQRWSAAMEALKGVWASKYNDRAYYSLRKVDLNFDDVRMAVLVQRVVEAKYAFVIHTKNPSNNDENEVFCELVRGLGESLVSGMVPGSSVAFKAKKGALDKPEVLCYASKSEGMFVPESLIFRSDSNGEDLDGYAGAGLYESITMDTTVNAKVDYMDDPLVQDEAYRNFMLSEICKVGASIEDALGSAQDIEGVVAPDNTITVVQTRPQV